MKRPRIRALFPPFVLLLTALELHAAVNITSPAVADSFPAVPAATDWSTASVAGTAPADAAALDAAVIANTTSAGVADALGSSPANPPVLQCDCPLQYHFVAPENPPAGECLYAADGYPQNS